MKFIVYLLFLIAIPATSQEAPRLKVFNDLNTKSSTVYYSSDWTVHSVQRHDTEYWPDSVFVPNSFGGPVASAYNNMLQVMRRIQYHNSHRYTVTFSKTYKTGLVFLYTKTIWVGYSIIYWKPM